MALDIVYVSSQSFRVRIVLRLFCWIPDSMRKIMTILRTSINRMNQLGNRIISFIRTCFPEQQLGHFAFFGSVLTHLESESYTVTFFRFLTLLGML